MSLKKISRIGTLLICIGSVPAFAAEEFVVKNIEIDGLQRITRQTVLEYLPVRPGQTLSESDTSTIINSLYQTGFFSDVSLARKGNTLVIQVVERATIGAIQIKGNKQVKTEDLLAALKQAGIAEGEGFNQATISGMKQALLEQYYLLGRYDATVDTDVTPESRNRVLLTINIYEGHIAKVKQINIIGNNTFSDSQLIKNFPMAPTHWWEFFSKSDDYSSDKLNQDLDALQSFYLDRGYLRFKVNSNQVTITPNRKDVYITISVTEGDVYRVKGFTITGNLLGEQAEVQKLAAALKPNEVFSRKKVLGISNLITRYYANQGYANATVTPKPEIDDANKQVFITFDVNPGRRVYVRNIDYSGNTKTADYVFRRETRQMEGAAYSAAQVDETKRRLNNLGYIENVDMKMEPVPGVEDQVDMKYSFKETSSTTASAQVGYSDTYGWLYGANIAQKNYKGTGNSVSLGFNNSQYAQTYSFNYFNPYYTQSGISRGFSLYFQQTTPDNTNLTTYTLDAYGAMMNYRMPLSNYDYLSFGYGYEFIHLKGNGSTSTTINDFLDEHGDNFNNVKITGGWTHNTYDRAILPTRGVNQYLGFEAGLPLLPSSLDYYKFFYNGTLYQPIAKGFIMALNTNWGYGNGYNGFDQLPFFKNFYAGGIGTVRGYEGNTLGPISGGGPIGGSVEATGSFNLIIPNPISEKLRTSVYVDAGNVFQNQLNISGMRASAGVEVDWVSPLGPLKFSLAKALNPQSQDQLEAFQFSVGTSL